MSPPIPKPEPWRPPESLHPYPPGTRCPACGYDLTSLRTLAPCPECGSDEAQAQRVRRAVRGAQAAGALGVLTLLLAPLIGPLVLVVSVATGLLTLGVRINRSDPSMRARTETWMILASVGATAGGIIGVATFFVWVSL